MKVLASDTISKKAEEKIKELADLEVLPDLPREELLEKVKETEVLIVRSKTTADKELIDAAPNLKTIIRAGVGLDNIDTKYAEEKGIQVLNTPEAPTESVAELVVGLMLSMLRNIPKANCSTKKGGWLKKELIGKELHKRTVGIIGLGRIGHKVAELLQPFGTNLIFHDPHLKTEPNAKEVSLDKLFKTSDIITIHAGLFDSTRDLLNKEAFEKMKDGVYIVNAARGPIINEDALCDALKSGKVAMAALDVFWDKKPDDKIIKYKEKIIFTPHLGGNTTDAQERIGDLLVEKVKSLL